MDLGFQSLVGFRIPKSRIPDSTTKICWMTESRVPYMGRVVLFQPRPQAQGAFPSALGTRLVLFLKQKGFISTSMVVGPHFSKVPVTLASKYSFVISFPALKYLIHRLNIFPMISVGTYGSQYVESWKLNIVCISIYLHTCAG